MGSPEISIAVVDQYINTKHSDLTGQFTEYGETGENEVSEADAVHGTQVASVIGAKHNNGLFMVGVAPECRIMPMGLSPRAFDSSADAANKINLAVQNGADVINCSWSVSSYMRHSQTAQTVAQLSKSRIGLTILIQAA